VGFLARPELRPHPTSPTASKASSQQGTPRRGRKVQRKPRDLPAALIITPPSTTSAGKKERKEEKKKISTVAETKRYGEENADLHTVAAEF